MNAVGIDVSKGKSTVAVLRPFGEVVKSPFEVAHTEDELSELANLLLSLDGETRVVMEYTGKYYEPIARYLRGAGLFVCVVHAMLIHNYGKNSIRRVKTDKADAVKIASYGIDRWLHLPEYVPEHDTRILLKSYSRQYNHYIKLKVMLKNNLIALLDQTFPGVNALFFSKPRKDDREKWVDFAVKFWHRECVCGLSRAKFHERYTAWCKRAGYKASREKADVIYDFACACVNVLPQNESTKTLMNITAAQLNATTDTLHAVHCEMLRLAQMLPEYPVVMAMRGVGVVLGPQLMAEIGDVRRFTHKGALTAFAGLDSPPFQSGQFESSKRNISKRGPSALRKTLFQVMDVVLKTAPADDAVFRVSRPKAQRRQALLRLHDGRSKQIPANLLRPYKRSFGKCLLALSRVGGDFFAFGILAKKYY